MANLVGDSNNSNVPAISGTNTAGGRGVAGFSDTGQAVYGESKEQAGVVGASQNFIGVWGESQSQDQPGVFGRSQNWQGVHGNSKEQAGVVGTSQNFIGVWGESQSQDQPGVFGRNQNWQGVHGDSTNQAGVVGTSQNFIGVWGESQSQDQPGVFGKGVIAGAFEGDVRITGKLTVNNIDVLNFLNQIQPVLEPPIITATYTSSKVFNLEGSGFLPNSTIEKMTFTDKDNNSFSYPSNSLFQVDGNGHWLQPGIEIPVACPVTLTVYAYNPYNIRLPLKLIIPCSE
ncbi:hypothetical protein [Bacillus paramycoides]|uniref:hypothetical protein n=1 Tax=Bacillus paramycoides TaxID=2026194 RepID=UPI002E235351|nr:hypothetical protein [Bacillus paramycoides]